MNNVLFVYWIAGLCLIILLEVFTGAFYAPAVAFVIAIAAIQCIGKFTLQQGFKNLTIKRQVEQNAIFEGEEFKIITIVENIKWLPISFLLVKEELQHELGLADAEDVVRTPDYHYRLSKYNVSWYERVKRPCSVKALRRGAYFLRKLEVTVGDLFGYLIKSESYNDVIELVVYPKLIDIQQFYFKNTNLLGEYIIQRWIHKDPLYIRGIREYNVEDRMKDIHWKSSLKMNKLMVRDFDYTSEKDIILIINVDCKEEIYNNTDYEGIELAAKLAVSLAKHSIDKATPVGIWSNALIMSYYGNSKKEVPSSIRRFKDILEYCGRMSYYPRARFAKYLKEKTPLFNANTQYILITPFLDNESISIIGKLRKQGIQFEIIDVASEGYIPEISGIEVTKCFGVGENESEKIESTSLNNLHHDNHAYCNGGEDFELVYKN